MSDTTIQIQQLLERLRAGDAAVREELINRSCERLRRLTRKMLHGDRLHRWEETDDVLQEGLLKLCKSLEQVSPASPRDFFRLATLKIRQALIDVARRHFGPQGVAANYASDSPRSGADGSALSRHEAKDLTSDPAQVVALNEIIEKLPRKLGEVFDLIAYHRYTHAEAAAILGVSTKTISRYWIQVCLRVSTALKDRESRR
jgi:RNA polymerase sigma factor (sigma-70 family)